MLHRIVCVIFCGALISGCKSGEQVESDEAEMREIPLAPAEQTQQEQSKSIKADSSPSPSPSPSASPTPTTSPRPSPSPSAATSPPASPRPSPSPGTVVDAGGTIVSLDRDADGVLNTSDNCPDTANADQANIDFDAEGDVCDSEFESIVATVLE